MVGELGQLAGLVEVAEPPEGVEGCVVVACGVEAVEFLEGLPPRSEPGERVEEGLEAGHVGVGEGVTRRSGAKRPLNTSGSKTGI